MLLSLAVALGACNTDTDAEDGEDASTLEGGPRRDGGSRDGGGVDEVDGGQPAAPETYCERMRGYSEECNLPLECGTNGFEKWCAQNTSAVDSDAYRRGYVQCATAQKCQTDERRDCMYRSYASTSQTPAQKALTQAYCQTCEPSDVAACAARVVTYSPPGSPETAFIASWELGDALTDQIRTSCTGGAIDGGGSPATCAKAFDTCAGGYYVDALVVCP